MKNRPGEDILTGPRHFKLYCHPRGFGFCLDTAGAGFNALASGIAGPLQIRQQALYGSAHAVRAFNGAGISLSADGAHSRHKSWSDL